jgi:phosphoglucomutase
MEEKRGISRFSEAGRGGLKIEFFAGSKERQKEAIACIWMRSSKTEPVFRVMADAESALMERTFIEWQRRMAMKADEAGRYQLFDY